MEGEGVDLRGVDEAFAVVAQLVGDAGVFGLRRPGLQLHAQQRALRAAIADADQGGAADFRVRIEDGFDLLGAQRGVARDHALRLSAAEPQAAFGIEIAEVAHAVDDARRRLRRTGRLEKKPIAFVSSAGEVVKSGFARYTRFGMRTAGSYCRSTR